MTTLSLVTVSPSQITTAIAGVYPATSYASRVNSKYNNHASNFVDLKTRLESAINRLPAFKQIGLRGTLTQVMKQWQLRFPAAKKLNDLKLVRSLLVPLSDILIDTTMQRELNLAWVLEILTKFRAVQAQPIQLYEVMDVAGDLNYYPAGTQLYASWDAQHTAIVYYIIAVWILGEDPRTVMVPVNIYSITQKSEIRQNFVSGNTSEGKKLLEEIDIFIQMVFGVRIDGNTNPKWVEAELKQQYLEQAELFVTNVKFGDTDQPGAISRMQEINGYTSDIIRKFCLYSGTIPVARPIASQEIEIMCAWFDMCKKNGIDYTDDEVVDLGNHLHVLFDANFHESSPFWDKAKTAYYNWHRVYWSSVPAYQRPSPSFSKNWRNGGAFLWYQLQKTWTNGRMPARLSISTAFQPNIADLY
jgi:hypothetical protein